jgi:translation initiation factor 2 beta subunit (eIF-2beta)/eIF-5
MADKHPYSIDELLDRAYSNITPHKGKINVPTPIVTRQNMRTYLTNFDKIVLKLNANDQDMLTFFASELEKNVSINEKNQLIICGSYDEKKISGVIKNYIKQRMMCKQCKSINTKVITASRIAKMHCADCNSFSGICL